jgi:ketosteroid isomerase-like protein
MTNTIETQILEAEERLRLAMIGSDVAALDELLAPELIFTSHLGQVFGKQADLEAHESGLVKVSEIVPSDQRVHVHGDVGVVSVQVHLSGSFAGTPSEGDFRFTRVWALSDGGAWQVVAGHSSIVA